MGISRASRREAKGLVVNVFATNTILGWTVVRQVPVEQALEQVALRRWREVWYDSGELAGVQPLRPEERKTLHQVLVERLLAVTITLPETHRNAGLQGRSHTIGRGEWARLHMTRKTRYGCVPVEPEDAVERAIEKVALWPYPVSRDGDRAVRVYPKVAPMQAALVFKQNDGEVTKSYYAGLNARGLAGELAVALFRAQKRSTAAKAYRGGGYRRASYDVKNWSLGEICRILQSQENGYEWGWQRDDKAKGFEWVLYVELPTGQCSFHSAQRLTGPDFKGSWDGVKGGSVTNVLAYCDRVWGL